MKIIPRRLERYLLSSIVLFPLIFFCTVLAGSEKVEFSIVARVKFSVPGDWKVISSKSDPNVTVFAFQISNPADEGTPDSTNLVFISYYLKDSSAKAAFEKKVSNRGLNALEKRLTDGWTCSTFFAKQGGTEYEDWDCTRILADCGVYLRVAWPHLPKNSPDYDNKMRAALDDVLKSVDSAPDKPAVATDQKHP
jgi:hypothetical protein